MDCSFKRICGQLELWEVLSSSPETETDLLDTHRLYSVACTAELHSESQILVILAFSVKRDQAAVDDPSCLGVQCLCLSQGLSRSGALRYDVEVWAYAQWSVTAAPIETC